VESTHKLMCVHQSRWDCLIILPHYAYSHYLHMIELRCQLGFHIPLKSHLIIHSTYSRVTFFASKSLLLKKYGRVPLSIVDHGPSPFVRLPFPFSCPPKDNAVKKKSTSLAQCPHPTPTASALMAPFPRDHRMAHRAAPKMSPSALPQKPSPAQSATHAR
jgi:hypothetical protein